MSTADVAFLALPLAVLLALARDRDERILAATLVIGFRAALALGGFHFAPPSQVVDMIGSSGGDVARLVQHERWGVWWPRYLFTWPAIAAAGMAGLTLDRTFPLWVAAVLPVEAFLAYRVAVLAAASVRARLALGLVISAAVLAVATLMNGRLVVAHAGMALILVTQTAAVRERTFAAWMWPALALGILMGHMTTGAGLVAYAQAVVGTLAVAGLGARTPRAAAVFAVAITVALGPLLFGDAWKNLTFFGFDPVALLGHGLGERMLASPTLWLVAVAAGASVLWGGVRVWRRRAELAEPDRRMVPAVIGALLSAAGGLFGYSTLSMGAPAGLVLVAQAATSGAPWAKRAFDLLLGAAALLVLGPIVGALAVAVRATSSGPAFYRAMRVGRGERPFEQVKLRTMVVGADRSGFRTAAGDPRITRLGRWLRALSLDELPQLWNVVRGDMSLVGPRPAAPAQLGDHTEAQRAERARVRPGITGLAQVSGRSALTLERSLALDIAYAREASVWLDVAILLRTIPAVVSRRGTN